MDAQTLQAYDCGAHSYAEEWEDAQDAPNDLYELLDRFFMPGCVFDIGCGSGRDAGWLSGHGHDVTGYDMSEALLEEARERHPGTRFAVASLPELAEIGTCRACNVLCETVLMHLPTAEISRAARRLYELVEPGGVLYVSWRVTPDADTRDATGRLYSAFGADVIREALSGAILLHDREQESESSHRTIHRIIVRRPR